MDCNDGYDGGDNDYNDYNDDDFDGGDNDYKAGGTRGPCCDNVWGVNVSI